MIKEVVIALLIGATTPMPTVQHTNMGECRITEYCPQCNDGSGYESSSGIMLKDGCCACNWLPIGTKINIEGETFTVVDTCGTDAIDIFIDTDECICNMNEYRKVVKNENVRKTIADMACDSLRKMAQHGMD